MQHIILADKVLIHNSPRILHGKLTMPETTDSSTQNLPSSRFSILPGYISTSNNSLFWQDICKREPAVSGAPTSRPASGWSDSPILQYQQTNRFGKALRTVLGAEVLNISGSIARNTEIFDEIKQQIQQESNEYFLRSESPSRHLKYDLYVLENLQTIETLEKQAEN